MKAKLLLYFFCFLSSSTIGQSIGPVCQRIGDESINYVNPEASPVGNYMIWIELDTVNGFQAVVWQCGIDPFTGCLIPENGKGFSPFTTNVYGRPADWGQDNSGLYYIGIDQAGRFVHVRPISAYAANVTILPTPPNLKRRAVYPSQMPDSYKSFITYIVNESTPGGPANPANNKFELRFLDLDFPMDEMIIETQSRVYPQFAGMDVIVPRWIKGTPYLTYGFQDAEGLTQVKELYAFSPNSNPRQITFDTFIKVDGFPVLNSINHAQYFLSGLNQTDSAVFYKRQTNSETFLVNEMIRPLSVYLNHPALNQSHEPFIFGKQLFSVFQINNLGSGFTGTTFNEPGEIWMTTVDALPQMMWQLSSFDSTVNVAEPEPFVGIEKAWVYYSVSDIDTTKPYLKRHVQLWKAETPLLLSSDSEFELSDIIESINVGPNPFESCISLTIPFSGFQISLNNLIGQQIGSYRDQKEIDLSNLDKGIYFLTILFGNTNITFKIYKKN